MSSLRHLCPSFSKVTGGSSLPCPVPIVPREAGLPWHPLAGRLARETWLCLWLRLGAALHAEPTRGCSLLLGFCTFLPAFSVSLLVLRSFVSFLLHSWVGWFFCLSLILFLHMLLLSGSRTSAVTATPGANQTLLAIIFLLASGEGGLP